MILSSMFTCGNLKNKCYTEQGLLGVTIRHHLQDSEVFKNTVHHVFFRQVFEFVDKVDHVFAHRRAVDPVNTLSSLQSGVLRLYFLNNLLAKRADFG